MCLHFDSTRNDFKWLVSPHNGRGPPLLGPQSRCADKPLTFCEYFVPQNGTAALKRVNHSFFFRWEPDPSGHTSKPGRSRKTKLAAVSKSQRAYPARRLARRAAVWKARTPPREQQLRAMERGAPKAVSSSMPLYSLRYLPHEARLIGR